MVKEGLGLCGSQSVKPVWDSRLRSAWDPAAAALSADDRSRVKFSLLEQGPLSGLLQVWRVPVSPTLEEPE